MAYKHYLKMTIIAILSIGILHHCAIGSDAVSVTILPPTKESGPEAGLIIVPGAYISGLAYQSLGRPI